ncbi:DUF4292 domain-containing protein [Mangrovimonas xylaniphaga]|uniref:DUF4292 domain-containing protein n=1 Tax=Mangrovimonas xylaniphaga TaxID=1645915 RepID=UPI0006B5C289|nr:DUF4292 domain-containing protein [Mangrovimonas xylaniphaga]
MMNVIKPLVLAAVLSLVVGCKSALTVSSSGELNKEVTAKQLIKENSKQELKFKTFQSKVKIDYIEGATTQSYGVNLRIEKDKVIWINATLGLARVMITPNEVKYYDKINNQFFDGDYRLLSELLGIELDFQKVQNLLLAEPIFGYKSNKYVASTHENSYVLQPEEQNAVLELFYLLNPKHFKMDSQQLYQPSSRRMFQIDYQTYQDVDKQIVPEKVHINAVEGNDGVTIDLEYKSVTFNEELRFPFKIPKGFKEIVIDEAN